MPERCCGHECEHQRAHWIEPRKTNARRDSRMAIKAGESGITLQQRSISDRVRIRSGASHAGRGDVDEIWIHCFQRVGAETQPIHDARREILDEDVRLCGEEPRDFDGLGPLQVEHDALFTLAEHRMQSARPPRIALAGRFHLDDFSAHRGEIARRRRAGDHPTEIEHAHSAERQRAALAFGSGLAAHEQRETFHASPALSRPAVFPP
jgi:hypothetical protein